MRLFSKRPGYLLLEAILSAVLIGMAAAAAVPLYEDWEDERRLDAAASAVCAIIREAQAEAHSVKAVGEGRQEKIELDFTNLSDGRVFYFGKRNGKNVEPKGYLPEGVTLHSTPVVLTFMKKGFTVKADKSYTVQLRTLDNRKGRNIVVAMYTGRVRVERYEKL